MSFTQEYRKFSVYMCKDPFVPSGMCYPEKCVSNYVTTSVVKEKSSFVISANNITFGTSSVSAENIAVSAYLVDDDNEYVTDVFIVPEDRDGICLLEGLACTGVADVNADASWYREGDGIVVKMPKIRSCGLNSLQIYYRSSNISYMTISSLGEITSTLPQFTQNTGSYLLVPSSLTNTNLLPGERVGVYYRMDGHEEYFLLGRFSFQTDVFTSAVIRGCGLVDKVKVYDDPTRPDDGYSYEYIPAEGGIGKTLNDDWLYDERLRWCVEYYGADYWLKSTFPCRLSVGDRIGILKNISDLPYTPDTDIDSSMSKETLSETNDRLVPEYYY